MESSSTTTTTMSTAANLSPPSLTSTSIPQEKRRKSCAYLLIENPTKSNNLGPILRCAAAFAVQKVIFIGYEKCSVRGCHGSSKHVSIISFFHMEEAISYLRDECGVVSIIGLVGDASLSCDSTMNILDDANADSSADTRADVNGRGLNVQEDEEQNVIKVSPYQSFTESRSSLSPHTSYPSSYPIHTRPFPNTGNVCFSLSKKNNGLPIALAKHCNLFAHVETTIPLIPNSSPKELTNNATTTTLPIDPIIIYGLLDSQTCLSIALHHFNAYAGHDERDFEGQKFNVAKNQRGRMDFDDNGEEKRKRRLKKKKQLQEEEMQMDDEKEGESMILSLFP
jgi:hypothetical protein